MTLVAEIEVPSIFDWELILSYLERETTECLYQVVDKKVRKLFKNQDGYYLGEIAYSAPDNVLRLFVQDTPPTSEIKEQFTRYVTEWFDLETSLDAFYCFAKEDVLLAPLVAKFHGLRLIGIPNFYEALTWGIIGQQINLSFAYTLKKRLVETYGESVTIAGVTYWLYPEPEVIARLSVEELMAIKLTRKKAEYLIDLSQKVMQQDISKAYYQAFKETTQAEKDLTSLRGVGPWTANYVLMRCLRKPDAFPMADIGLLNGLKVMQNLAEKPTKTQVLELKERWGDWCCYATFYIWRLLY